MTAPFVFAAMGTMVSVHSVRPLPRAVEDAVMGAFVVLEERFSLWRPDSEASAVARRETGVTDTSETYRLVYELAVRWRARTQGAFTPHRPDGVIDLSGIVKALALDAARDVLVSAGFADWCLNAGGDVLTDGVGPDGRPWVVGIVDPAERGALLSRVTAGAGRRAVATSGIAERGEHVWRIGSDGTFVQVSVAADDIVTADVLATAILAAGPDALTLAHDIADIDVLACTADGRFWASSAFRTAA